MAMIKFDKVVSVNSEAQGHNAQNLLNPEVSIQKSWLCEKGTDKAIVILQLERAAVISAIHVGNAHSAFVEVLVGRASDASDQYESLIPMSTFMNPNESKTNKNPNAVRFFNKTDFEEKAANKQWDRVKVVCSQPFNKLVPFGLCFIKVLGEKEPGSEGKKPLPIPTLKDDDTIKIGSFFKRKKDSQETSKQELSVSEQIREAEKPESLRQHTPICTRKLTAKMSEKHSDKGKKRTKRKDKDEDDEDDQSDNRKNADLGLEDENSTPKKPKLDRKKEKESEDTKGKGSERKKTEPKKEKKKKEASEKNKPKKPFNKLMDDVVFVISGFKNPLRGTIRTKATDMGAKYSGDWDSKCTHLICAYENTPKFNQVKGEGKIIKKDWIEKCHEDRRRYPWRRYALDEDDRKQNESEDEIIADDDLPKPGDDIPSSSNVVTRDGGKRTPVKQGSGYDVATDDEEDKKEDTTNYPMPFLPDVFSMKTFYVDNNIPNRATIERYIIAYNGIITENLNNDVEFYITNTGGPSLEIFHKKAPNFIAVKPSWIWEINAKQQWIPTSQFLVK